MIQFVIAALADVVTSYVAKKRGGVEVNPLLRSANASVQLAFQLVLYSVALVLGKHFDVSNAVWWIMASAPALVALNNARLVVRAK